MTQKINLVVIALLLLLFGLLIFGSLSLSITSDEPAHIAVGYALLARGKDAYWVLPQHGHPPLLNVMEAGLLYLSKPDIPVDQLDGWPLWLGPYVRAFAYYLPPMERLELAARMPIILLTVLLGAIVFRWGKDLWGPGAGLLALAALTFDPTLLAHGRLATTDVGSITLGTAALYATWRWMKRPSWQWTLAGGALLGLTMLAKGSGVIWTASAGLMVLVTIFMRRKERPTLLLFGQGIAALILSLLVLWAGYGFSWGTVRSFPIPVPAPEHWDGFLAQALSAPERWVFALGERKHGDWWWYFPLGFLIKNPLPLLIFVGMALGVLVRRSFSWLRVVALALFPLVYTAAAISGGMNIGYRHMLPIHPMLYLCIGGGLWQWAWAKSSPVWRKGLLGLLGAWYVLALVSIFPYEIAYFNELIGGPKNGQEYFIDSNIDWGQGYKAIKEYLAAHPGPKPQIANHYVNVNLSIYGIDYVALPPEWTADPLKAPYHPLPGRYFISITSLQRGWAADPDMYAWFRQVKPTARLAYSFFVYEINPPPLEWFSQCVQPAPPLEEPSVANGFGRSDLRRADFDCTAAWLYPTGGAQPGAYALHHTLVPEKAHELPSLLPSTPQATDPFIARRLASARLSLDMRRYTPKFPAFVLYEQEHPPALPSPSSVLAMPATMPPTAGTSPRTSPVALQGPLSFLGTATYRDKGGLDVETWWQVTDSPITRPFSIMAHLLTPDGQVLNVADGLGVSPLLLQVGDVVVQRHRFPNVPAGQTLWLRTGAYWSDSMQRWPVAETPGADALFVRLEAKP
jgi:4-amino-4-deoxy-L-arabinose transferase-like glycosyltransferase